MRYVYANEVHRDKESRTHMFQRHIILVVCGAGVEPMKSYSRYLFRHTEEPMKSMYYLTPVRIVAH
jgi:hypothetical protein